MGLSADSFLMIFTGACAEKAVLVLLTSFTVGKEGTVENCHKSRASGDALMLHASINLLLKT